MIIEGDGRPYGFNKLMKVGLEDNLAKVRVAALDPLRRSRPTARIQRPICPKTRCKRPRSNVN